MYRRIIKKIVFAIPVLKRHYIKLKEKEDGPFIRYEDLRLDQAENVFLYKEVDKDLVVGLVKDDEGVDGMIRNRAYYPKYERFLRNNDILFQYFDIRATDWQEKAEKFNVIVWHTASDPSSQAEAKSKIYILDKIMKKTCLPSFDEIWSYEDKINAHYFYKSHDLPEIPTFVTYTEAEALKYINNVEFPIISKIATGSASKGVERIKTKDEAIKLIYSSFSRTGRKTYFRFQRQKGYVYFQKFIDSATFDLRVMVVGNKLFGYYRYPKKGDFKASGAGIVEKKDIPILALDLAFKVKELYGANFLATDLLYCNKTNQFLIIESSIFIGVDTCEQLVVDGIAGYYERKEEGSYLFKEGRYWVQELTLRELLNY